MDDKDLQVLVDYMALLEAELQTTDPQRFQQLTQKREGLMAVLQAQQRVLEKMRKLRESDQSEITKLQSQLDALNSASQARKAAR
jgi:hypothetical protein